MERASHGAEGFFDVERRLEAISAKGDPLEMIKKIVPWEDFRAGIEAVTETKPEQRKSNTGRKPYDFGLLSSTALNMIVVPIVYERFGRPSAFI
jgi:hypothetical protein